jgi:hypothetical protein
MLFPRRQATPVPRAALHNFGGGRRYRYVNQKKKWLDAVGCVALTEWRSLSAVKNLFEATVLDEVKERLGQLRSDSERLWGKMNDECSVSFR